MRLFSFLLLFVLPSLISCSQETVYTGSTPAGPVAREFLQINTKDSIDFIRWKLVIGKDKYHLDCQYGLCKPNTNGFTDEKKLQLSGFVEKHNPLIVLNNGKRSMNLFIINENILHLMDKGNRMLSGNGGFSYALNNENPVATSTYNTRTGKTINANMMVFEGRTPCQPIANILSMGKSANCNKLKWYIIFYRDSITGLPSHYLNGGTGYRKETMAKGKWEIHTLANGKVMYKLFPEKLPYKIYLIKIDENILAFSDPDGKLFIGNEDFSYTLNRRESEHPVTR